MPAPTQTGVALATARPNGVALTEDERRWDQLVRMANVYANSKMVAKGLQGNPNACMSALLLCDAIGVDPRTSMGGIDLIDDKLEPRAQVYLSAANAHGWETKWGHVDRDADTGDVKRVRHVEPSEERAELLIRPYGTDDEAWESYSFTAAQAAAAHLLDEWVEQKTPIGQWPDGNPKYEVEKFVLGRPGVDVPEWAEKKIRAGEVKHNNQWWNWRRDMLSARCAKWAVKRAAPGVMFGAVPASIPPGRAATVIDHMPDDEDIVDGEIVPGAAPSAAYPPGTQQGPESSPDRLTTEGPAEQPDPLFSASAPRRRPRPAHYPLRIEDQASDLERALLQSLLDTLTPAAYARAQQMATAAGIPNIYGAHLSSEHAVLLSDLIRQIRLETPAPKPEAAGPPGAPVADGPSPDEEKGASPNVPSSAARRPGPSANTLPLDQGRPFDDD